MNDAVQLSLGTFVLRSARRCYDLSAAVPAEYEAGILAEGDTLVQAAALLGDEEAEREVAWWGRIGA